jgi:hypothetical protein
MKWNMYIICDHPNANITKDIYKQLIEVTDKLEVTLSAYLRCLVEKELKENQKEEYNNE